MQETLHYSVLRIDKVLKRKGWQDRLDDPFAESDLVLAEPWKAALDGCWRPPRRSAGRANRSTVAMNSAAQLSPNPRVSKPPTRRVSDPGPAGVAARLRVATAGSRSPRFPTKPPSTGGRSATGRR